MTTAAQDIVVRRCTVQVVRHGGWSWGPQPRRLVDQVLAALPGLIAARLADLAPDGAPDVEITEPVRIVVSLTLADLLAGRFDPLHHAAISLVPRPEPPPASLRPQPPVRHRATPLPDLMSALLPRAQPATLAEFLAGLFQRGELGQFLALLPADTLEAWYQALTASSAEAPGAPRRPGTPPSPGAPLASAAVPVVPRPAAERLRPASGQPAAARATSPPGAAATPETARSRQLRDAIIAIAARASQQTPARPPAPSDPGSGFRDRPVPADPGPVGSASVGHALVRPVPGGPASVAPQPLHPAIAASAAIAANIASAGRPAGEAARPPGAAPAHAGALPSVADAEIASALPFLLLGPLAQTGYLPALAPALEPVGLQAQTAAFATALGYTVLGPLERGWRHRPGDLAAAAAFSGLAAPVSGQDLTEFARAAAPALPALDAVVTRALAEGHSPGEPLILAGAEEGTLLLDREGLFPLAWADTVTGLLPAWRMCGSPPVLVAPTALGALRGLTAAGATFVVATPPGRGERWRRLPPHRLWTNGDDPALPRIAAGYQQATDLTAGLVQALAAERAAVPLAAGPALGRSLLLAAGLGLGTLAWTLWRDREPTDPLLTLERFADLSALVSFGPHRVRVRLPLGPRHADLSAHGLLADVPGVPWLGGRVVEFSGG